MKCLFPVELTGEEAGVTQASHDNCKTSCVRCHEGEAQGRKRGRPHPKAPFLPAHPEGRNTASGDESLRLIIAFRLSLF